MFGIKKLIYRWILKRKRYELCFFIDTLKMMTPRDVSLIVMLATNIRNAFIEKMNWDLGNPIELLEQKPSTTIYLGNMIRDCKRNNQFIERAAYIVWLHTLRVASMHELIPLGQELWTELGRGIEYLNNNPDLVKKCTTQHANPIGYDLIPKLA